MSCLSARAFDEGKIDTVLDGVQKTLDVAKDALALAPIPGLDIAAGTLSSIVGMVKVRCDCIAVTVVSCCCSKLGGTTRREKSSRNS